MIQAVLFDLDGTFADTAPYRFVNSGTYNVNVEVCLIVSDFGKNPSPTFTE